MGKEKLLIRRAPAFTQDKYVICLENGRPILTLHERRDLQQFTESPFNINYEFINEFQDKKKRADLSGIPGEDDPERLKNSFLLYSPFRGRVKFGYIRVSTAGQSRTGNSLEDQLQKVRDAGAEHIYKDICTGTKIDRPQFDQLLQVIRPGDTLIVTKLDRFARSAGDGIRLIDDLNSKGITVNVLNMGVIDGTPTGKLIRNIFLCFAEFERDMIVERTQAGKAVAKTKSGFHEGRPRTKEWKIRQAMQLLDEGKTYSETVKETGISKSTLIRYRKTWKRENNEIPGQLRITNINMDLKEES